jgi:hypothetical protein
MRITIRRALSVTVTLVPLLIGGAARAGSGYTYSQVADFPFVPGLSSGGAASEALINFSMNDKGQVAYSTHSNIAPQLLSHTSLYFWDPVSATTSLLFSGDQGTSSPYLYAGTRASVGLNNDGLVAAYGYPAVSSAGLPLSPGTVEGLLYFQALNVGVVGVADAAYNGTTTQNALFTRGNLNSNGQVAFFGSYYDNCRFGTTSPTTTLAIPTWPATAACNFPFGYTASGPIVNNAGQAAFLTTVQDASGIANLAISDFSPVGPAVTNTLIGAYSDWYQPFGSLALNDRGYAAFTTRRNTLSSTGSFRVALLGPNRATPTVLVDETQFGSLADPGFDVAMNNFNQIVFGLTAGNSVVGGALWMTNPADADTPIRVWSGDDFAALLQPGSAASLPALAPGDNFTVNNHGDVVFAAAYTNLAGVARVGLFVAHPTPGLTPANPVLPGAGDILSPYGFRFVGACSNFAAQPFATPSGATLAGATLPCYVDPPVASGYTFTAGAGSPAFASVRIPAPLSGGQSTFDLQVEGQSLSVAAGHVIDFTTVNPNGVSSFVVAGISANENLDPNSPTAFVAGLTWVGGTSSANSFTMIPIVQSGSGPTISHAVSGTSGTNGWYTGDVTVTWTVIDPSSTITSQTGCTTTVINTDAAGQTLTCTATSAGGTTTESVTIKRDATAPTASIATPADGVSYARGSVVSAAYACADTLSGIAICAGTAPIGSPLDTAAAGSRTFTVTPTDTAGNAGAAVTVVYTVTDMAGADTTPPVIAPTVSGTQGDNGWYRSSVTINWQVTDPQSPVTAQSGCGATSVTQDTNGITFTCHATSTGGTSSRAVTIKRDVNAPLVALLSPLQRVTYNRNQKVYALYACVDARSGITQCTGTAPSGARIDTASAGGKSFTVNSRDRAGNTKSATMSYTVR